MLKKIITIMFLLCFGVFIKAQNDTFFKVYKKKKFEILGIDENIAIYKKANSSKYYFSAPNGNKLIKLSYFNIIHKNGNTYKIRENCRELRRRSIKLYDKYSDGEYYIFKVFNSFIQ